MKSAQKLAKLIQETGDSKPLSKYLSKARSKQAKKQWSEIPKANRRKPKTAIKLSRRAHYAIIREWDAIASEAQLYQSAYSAKLYSLCWQMRENIKDRLFGKPFTASNPEDGKAGNIYQDNRLQIAMGLLPQSQLPANNQTSVTTTPETKTIDAVESES